MPCSWKAAVQGCARATAGCRCRCRVVAAAMQIAMLCHLQNGQREVGACLHELSAAAEGGRLAGSGTETGHHDCGFKELLRGCWRRCAVDAAKAQGAIILRASTIRRPKQPATPATMHIISRLRSSRRLSSWGTWQRGGTGARSARPQNTATKRARRPSEGRCLAHTRIHNHPPTCHPQHNPLRLTTASFSVPVVWNRRWLSTTYRAVTAAKLSSG